MKKTFFFIAILIASAAFSQGRRDGQSGIHAQYGILPSMSNTKETAFMANLGYLKVFSGNNDKGWLGKAEAFYGKYEVDYRNNQRLDYERYGVNVQAGWTYEGLRPVYFNLFAGAFAGYEKVNKGSETFQYDNSLISKKVKGFTYGLTGSAEVEYAVIQTKLSLIANYTQFVDLKSDFSKGVPVIFAGIRYYIN